MISTHSNDADAKWYGSIVKSHFSVQRWDTLFLWNEPCPGQDAALDLFADLDVK